MTWETDFSTTPCVVTIRGDVDISATHTLAQLEKTLAERDGVVVDVRNLRYTDTTFLRFLLRLRAHANKASADAVRLQGGNHALQRVMDITGLRRMFAWEA